MTEIPVQPRRHARRFRLLFLVGILVTLVSCAGLDLWAGRQVDAEVARIEARYGSLDEATLLVPAVPAADNRARIVRAAAALTIPLPDTANRYVLLRASSPVPATFRTFAEANRPAIRMADDIGTRRQSNWEIDYRRAGDQMPWAGILVVSDALYVTALLDIEGGRADDAAHAIASGLAVSASLRQEPEAFAQQMRMSTFAGRQFLSIQRLVTQLEPSKAAVENLAAWLAENSSSDPMGVGMLGELKQTNALMTRLENGQVDRGLATYLYPETWPDWGSAWVGPIARIGRPFVRLARLRYVRQMGQLLDAQTGPRPRPAFHAPPEPKRWALIDRLSDKFVQGTERYLEVGDDFSSELAATELAVALRRFRLDHGTYPQDLSALVPAYLARVRIDPYTGQPPVYARQGAGFTLHAGSHNPNTVTDRAFEWTVLK